MEPKQDQTSPLWHKPSDVEWVFNQEFEVTEAYLELIDDRKKARKSQVYLRIEVELGPKQSKTVFQGLFYYYSK